MSPNWFVSPIALVSSMIPAVGQLRTTISKDLLPSPVRQVLVDADQVGVVGSKRREQQVASALDEPVAVDP